jgi:hypothetical protein
MESRDELLERIDDLKDRIADLTECNLARKEEKRQVEAFTLMLLKQNRTTKEELSKYFRKR